MISGYWRNKMSAICSWGIFSNGRYFSWGIVFQWGFFLGEFFPGGWIFFPGGIFFPGAIFTERIFSGGKWGISSGGNFYPAVSSGTFNLRNHHILSNAT
jgi:hypothetical protein